MTTKMTSSEVAGGDDALASDLNLLRDDIILNAGDYAAATGSSNAFILAIDASVASLTEGDVFKFKANHTITGSASIDVNSIGAETIKKGDGATNLDSGDITNGQLIEIQWDGSNFQMISAVPGGAGGSTTPRFTGIIEGSLEQGLKSASGGIMNNGEDLVFQNSASGTTAWKIRQSGIDGGPYPANATIDTSPSIAVNVACRVTDGATEYLLAFAYTGTTVKRYDADGSNETSVTFSGQAVATGAIRIGFDGTHVWIQDGSNGTSTTIRKYTFTGTVLTFVATVTLSQAPIDHFGTSQQMIGTPTYLLIASATSFSAGAQTINVYNKSTGTFVETVDIGYYPSGNVSGITHNPDDPTKAFLIWFTSNSVNDSIIVFVPYEYE